MLFEFSITLIQYQVRQVLKGTELIGAVRALTTLFERKNVVKGTTRIEEDGIILIKYDLRI